MLAVAFEGCACRAAFHAGVAAALAERALPVALTAGASSRSLFDMSHLVRTTLERVLGGTRADLRGHPVEGLVTATRLRDLGRVVFSTRHEPDMLPPLLASCFFP